MRVVYLGQFHVDFDSAARQRVLGISSALVESGHQVLVVGQGQVGRRNGPRTGIQLEGFCGTGQLRVRQMLSAQGAAQWLANISEPPDLVIVYGGTGRLNQVVRNWARRLGVPRVVDSVEWYDRPSMPGGKFGPRAIDNEISMRRRYPAYDGAIAISSFLERHYLNCGTTQVVRVPPVTDVSTIAAPPKPATGPITILYAGSPGAKDSLGIIVSALRQVDPAGDRMRLEVLGVTRDQGAGLPNMPEQIPPSVTFRGRVTRDRVLAALTRAHYVPIIRRDERYAHAGFPTKLVEAMSSGTPVIANHTSDLAWHVRHQETGVVAPGASVEAVGEALRLVIEGGHAMAGELSGAARQEAVEQFDYRRYSRSLDQFVRSVVEGKP